MVDIFILTVANSLVLEQKFVGVTVDDNKFPREIFKVKRFLPEQASLLLILPYLNYGSTCVTSLKASANMTDPTSIEEN